MKEGNDRKGEECRGLLLWEVVIEPFAEVEMRGKCLKPVGYMSLGGLRLRILAPPLPHAPYLEGRACGEPGGCLWLDTCTIIFLYCLGILSS